MTRRTWLLVLVILAVALGLRVAFLTLRPPHHDEGVNGWFTEKLLRDGYYAYDQRNYHGPAYFYLLAGARELLGFGLWSLRLPGALVGALLCLAPLGLRRELGSARALAAAALLAVCPTQIYYARYAIHEPLLVALVLAMVVVAARWAATGRARWIVAGGALLALMVATKETTVLFVGVAGLWLTVEVAVESWRARRLIVLGRVVGWSWRVPAVAAATLLVAGTIHVLLFTGFFQEPGSIREQLARSVRAYAVWTKTGTSAGGHVKPWTYYLRLGARYELVLYALAVIGAIAGARQRWVRGPAVVGFALAAVYSAIGYKMPWLPMTWLALLAVPAGHGLVVLAQRAAAVRHARLGVGLVLAAALAPALAITVRSSFVRPADPREALAYVHTSADYQTWTGLIDAGAARVGRARLRIGVAHSVSWPMPWTLSQYRRTHWAVLGDEDVMIVAASKAPDVERKLRHAYFKHRYGLRASAEPAVVYLRRSLYARILGVAPLGFELVGAEPFDAFANQRSAGAPPQEPSGRVVPGIPLWIGSCKKS